ncbi:hypothetical protein NA57DRAFT_78594 [Rhizodiscina lignyota]|uniref:Uncharacterized protein n=1 Tax=Rhizodiscina lignyota TaxID=1504668 RepID=A0A9P4M2L9_9PEZI|nr:hypothetical protein NA57DRAFT_78594 [Rhizodiscina lignyota]
MSPEPAQHLKQKLAITPKTAGLLIEVGFRDYRDLRSSSPGLVVEQLKELATVTAAQAEGYRRGLRRMVWLATQDEPEEQAKLNLDWTQKALKARGIWSDDFDTLTGEEINQRIQARASSV